MTASCRVCCGSGLDEIDAFAELGRVTSDCKPWPAGGRLFICQTCGMVQKIPDPTWREEASRIYRDYALYPQAGGAEQALFDGDGKTVASRSDRIVERISEIIPLPDGGRLLDMGCGNGAFLAAFARRRQGWELHGAELDGRHAATLAAIPGFKKLHTGGLDNIGQDFDLVSLIHVLEHVERPEQLLEQIHSGLSKPGGHVAIQVPDWTRNPFDLLIADHLLHFTPPHLARLAVRSGLAVLCVAEDWIEREISLLAGGTGGGRDVPAPPDTRATLESHIGWLKRIGLEAKKMCDGATGGTGVFGSSIAAAWLYGTIGGGIDFFVDEDPSRAGGKLFGIPILPPDRVPGDASVFVPMAGETADRIVERLDSRNGPRYMGPKSTPDDIMTGEAK